MSIASNAGAQAAAEEIAAFVAKRRAVIQTERKLLDPITMTVVLDELRRIEEKAKEIAATAESGWY